MHVPTGGGWAHSQWDWAPRGARLLASSSRHPKSTPHVTPHAFSVPRGHVGCFQRGEGAQRLWGAPGRRGGAVSGAGMASQSGPTDAESHNLKLARQGARKLMRKYYKY